MTHSLPRAVIFDWDNTLVDSWEAIAASINATFAHFGKPQWDMKQIRERCTRSARESFPEWFGDKWKEAYEMYYANYNRQLAEGLRLKPSLGAYELLDWLFQRKIPLCIVSNKNGKNLRLEVEALGWDRYFLSVVGAADAARDKPAREHPDHALKLAKIDHGSDIWFVGDSETDIVCARNVECTPFLIGSKDFAQELDVKLYASDCGEMLGMLKSIS